MRFTQDTGNNIGRRCDIVGLPGKPARSWKITDALKDELIVGSVTHYRLRNDDGTWTVARSCDLSNLY